MRNKKLLIIAGPSGGGKTYIENLLSKAFNGNLFNKIEQITTRPMREGESQGNPYYFVSDEEYDSKKDKLIGKTFIGDYKYGSLFNLDSQKINTVILNKEGIEDFLLNIDSDISYRILMIDSTIPVKREHRDKDYIEMEKRKIRKVANYVLTNTKEKYITIEDVISTISDFILE